MRTLQELNEIREELKALKPKLAELTEEELAEVIGGRDLLDLIKNPGPDLTLESVVYHLGFRRVPVWVREQEQSDNDGN